MTRTEKYRPKRIDDFIGLDKVKKILSAYASRGRGTPLLFHGKTGTGKSQMALALAKQISATAQVIAHSDTQKETFARLAADPGLFNGSTPKRQLIVIDHADLLPSRRQVELRAYLDGLLPPIGAIWVLIAEDLAKIEEGLASRCLKVPFSTYGNSKAASAFLEHIWDTEVADQTALRPNFARILKEANGSLRASISRLETLIDIRQTPT